MKIITFIAAVLLAGQATAQSVEGTATAQSQSGVYTQGDNVRSGSVGLPSAISTAPCIKGSSAGLTIAGTGLGIGISAKDRECIVRKEAEILAQISHMKGEQRKVAVLHFCRNDESMRDTMVAMGWCRVVSK